MTNALHIRSAFSRIHQTYDDHFTAYLPDDHLALDTRPDTATLLRMSWELVPPDDRKSAIGGAGFISYRECDTTDHEVVTMSQLIFDPVKVQRHLAAISEDDQ